MEKVIEVSELCKSYSGTKVVNELSFSASQGDIVGLIGPNGAGKSTTMKIILRLINKEQGTIKVMGKPVDKNANTVSKLIGFTSEAPAFYNYLSGYDNLKIISNLYPEVKKDRISELLEFVGLQDAASRKVKTYSTGMKQRLGLARALIGNPQLVILDEPTNGLDPQGMREIYKLIMKLAKEEKKTFIISSHLLHDIERICNKIVVINKGNTIYNGDIEDIREQFTSMYSIASSNASDIADELEHVDGIQVVTSDIDSVTVQIKGKSLENVTKDLKSRKLDFKNIMQIKPSLEDLFFVMTKEA